MSRVCGHLRHGEFRSIRLILLGLFFDYEKQEGRLHYSRASGWMLASPSPVAFFAQYFFTQAS
jgi:hypothetical protein